MDGLVTGTRLLEHEAEDRNAYPIVAIGASAGGLVALERVFQGLPRDLAASYVVIQHLSPNFDSHMTELLGRVTRLPVAQAVDGVALEPQRIYVIPPRKEMILSGGKLLLTDKDPRNAPSLPIDTFFRSLAQESGHRAIAVVLSGTGSDGARGVRAVKNAGGFVIVQEPTDAEFDGMPRNALATGAPDSVLAADEIAAEIGRIAPLLLTDPSVARLPPVLDDTMRRVLDVLAQSFDVDFTCYKTTTLVRRIRRRIELASDDDPQQYLALIARDPEERRRLYQDLLIGVTDFFRDPETYEALTKAVRSALFTESSPEVRVWVAGCATGEEVYSVAILLDEVRHERRWTGRIRLFATDIQQEALKRASAGIYPAESLAAMPRARVERHFTPEPGGKFRVAERLREMVVFATHNLISDAPFTQLDLICCRNVLIYFQPPTQSRVLGLFHFGLRTGGLLFMGPSETLGKFEDEFEPISADAKIFSKRRDLRLSAHSTLAKIDITKRRRLPAAHAALSRAEGASVDVYESLLERYIPMAFLLDDTFALQHCFHGAEQLLALKGGRVSTALPALLEGRLKTAVSGLLERFRQDGGTHGVNVRPEGGDTGFNITVAPVSVKRSSTINVLVEVRPLDERESAAHSAPADSAAVAAEYVESLERDLEFARGQLQSTIEELEASNEELQAANEELVASNEELQSTNEELRSVNEELNTVNIDHQNKIIDLLEVTSDLENLLHTIHVGVLFLDNELRIRRANRRIGDLLHILPQDVGRSFAHFKNNLEAPAVFEVAQRVLASGEPAEAEVKAASGLTLLLSVIPHVSQGAPNGVVLTLVDITSLKAAESEARRLSSIVRTARDAIISHSLDGRIVSWNLGAERLFGYTEAEARGQDLRLVVPDDLQGETAHLIDATTKGLDVPPFETVRRTKDGRRLNVLVSVAPIRSERGIITGASVITLDITARKEAEDRAAMAIEQREKFLALLSHELRNPLMAIASANEVLSRSDVMDDAARRSQQVISRQITQMSRLLEDTLDASRMRHDKIELQRKRIDMRTVLEAAMDVTRPRGIREHVRLEVRSSPEPVYVRADAARMQQVIVNLTQNAINHSGADKVVMVTLATDGDNALVRIEDNGEGISREALPRIFEPFFQASRRSSSGMGLGLSLARSIVRAHGGDIVAASQGLGRGARFEVRLPLVDMLSETVVDPPAQHRDGGGPPLIVLVDDDAESRESLGILLRRSGYEVFEAGDAMGGLELIERVVPGVAVIDIGLPDVSGLEMARRVRRKFGANQVRLIALTGFGRQDDREAAIEAGCDMHLVKPIDFSTLESVIAYQASR
jgi:two-component system CheB/CheR fusion protein